MRLSFLPLPPALRPLVHAFWLFESPRGLPPQDRRMVVPNGRPKLIVTLEGPLEVSLGEGPVRFAEGRVWFVGPWDRPVALGSPPGPVRTIGMEFQPSGPHHWLGGGLHEWRNRIGDLEDIEPRARALRSIWQDRLPIDRVVAELTGLLMGLKEARGPRHWLVDEVTDQLRSHQGMLTMADLERRTGYSRRAISLAFRDGVGLAPKTLGTILRFQAVYRLWASGASHRWSQDLYQGSPGALYADQSHLIREFRRYTGLSPGQFDPRSNEFGRLFYISHLSKTATSSRTMFAKEGDHELSRPRYPDATEDH